MARSSVRIFFTLLWLIAGALPVTAADRPHQADLVLGAAREQPGKNGQLRRTQTAAFTLGGSRYVIRHQISTDPANGGKLIPGEGYIGMPVPSNCNWYHNGFLFVILNGQDIGARTPLSSMTASESGRRAILDLVWHDPLANVRNRFLGLPDGDCLNCEVAIEPKEEIKSIELRLTCYPSYFTSWYHRDGARRIQTNNTLVVQGKPAVLPPAANWCAVYYDEVFDVARKEGLGPCAMLFLPDEATEVIFDPGSYAVQTRIRYAPTARRMRLALWDFGGTTNADVLKRLPSGADSIRRQLASLDFTPATLTQIDLTQLRSDAERALKSPSVRSRLGDKATADIQAWLDQPAPRPKPGAPMDIPTQEHLLAYAQQYNDFQWQLKLAELLDSI